MFGFKKLLTIFGFKKNMDQEEEHPLPPTLLDAAHNINKSAEETNEKIRKLDVELVGYNEQIKKTRPGPAQKALKAQVLRTRKKKKFYEGQRERLNNLSQCIQ